MIAEVPLNVLFSLLNLDQPREQWIFYVNFRPVLEDRGLADALYGAGLPGVPLLELPSAVGAAEMLVREVRSHVAPDPVATVGSLVIPVVGGLTGVSHYIRWYNFDTQEVRWVRHFTLNGRPYEVQPKEGGVPLPHLSDASRSAVKKLDSLATEIAYSRFAEVVRTAAALPPGVKLVPEKRRVFLSYRTPHSEIARALHRSLESYANSTAFRPYLDRHELQLGDLPRQLRERISDSDLFMPIVSEDYAAEGSVSAAELDWATQVSSSKGGLERFFAPVYLGRPGTSVADDLGNLARLEISSSADLSLENSWFRDFLRMCAVAYG